MNQHVGASTELPGGPVALSTGAANAHDDTAGIGGEAPAGGALRLQVGHSPSRRRLIIAALAATLLTTMTAWSAPSSATLGQPVQASDPANDGSLLLGTAGRGLVRWHNGAMTTLAADGRPVGPVIITPDNRILYGTRLAKGRATALYYVRPGADAPVARFGATVRHPCTPGALTPVSATVLMAQMYNEEGDYCTPARINLTTGKARFIPLPDYGQGSFGPDGRWIAFNDQWIPVRGGSPIQMARGGWDPAFSGDGQLAAFATTTKRAELPGLLVAPPGQRGRVVPMQDYDAGTAIDYLYPIAWVDADTVLAFAPMLNGSQGSTLLFDVATGATTTITSGTPLAYNGGQVLVKRWLSPNPAVDKTLVALAVVDLATGEERIVSGDAWRDTQDFTIPPQRRANDPLVVVPVGLRRQAIVSLPSATSWLLPAQRRWYVYASAYEP